MKNIRADVCMYCRRLVLAGEGYAVPPLWRDKGWRVRHARKNGACIVMVRSEECTIREPHEHNGVSSTGVCWRNAGYTNG